MHQRNETWFISMLLHDEVNDLQFNADNRFRFSNSNILEIIQYKVN